MTAYTGSDEIAYVGYVESCDDPINKTMVLAIARSKLEMTGNIIASGNWNISGTTPFNNATTTCISSLTIAGSTTLNIAITCISSLTIAGLTTLSNNNTIYGALNVCRDTIINNNLGILTPSISSNYNLQVNRICFFGAGSQYVSPLFTVLVRHCVGMVILGENQKN